MNSNTAVSDDDLRGARTLEDVIALQVDRGLWTLTGADHVRSLIPKIKPPQNGRALNDAYRAERKILREAQVDEGAWDTMDRVGIDFPDVPESVRARVIEKGS